ncbi:chemotaxis protein CheA [Pseudomaricurvus alkylphenolicus]|uniref:chemotaxis protein CheA n=1 Tax=Pseudomaricurvus alkylphenolicus TaxID=1306991 RepID=UPI0014237E56|nr:chemotaxis protein CheA [Pseudomaricurvus alkylphenolicus]NIB43210.1 chemotaxis protein CheA [Pseudomaricurvus alkylphenolicus]
MSVDLSQFHQVFFEESFEGLDAMESALMELDPAAVDTETINTIFRAAHSIKGGSATFGFSIVAEFTHVLETLLDEIRSGTRSIRQEDIDLFLQSVDCLRDLLHALQQGQEPDKAGPNQLQAEFEEILASDPAATQTGEPPVTDAEALMEAATAQPDAPQTDGPWRIIFRPGRDVLRTGNEPLRMLRELAELGRISVTPLLDRLPSFSGLEPEGCFLGFEIIFRDRIDRDSIVEVFEWVADESELDIRLACEQSSSAAEESSSSAGAGWKINFRPGEDILRTGNEPLRIFRELADLGTLQVEADVTRMPDWSTINPESSYLGWRLQLPADVEREAIDEAFEWVVDDSDLVIEQNAGATDVADREDADVSEAPSADSSAVIVAQAAEAAAVVATPSVEPQEETAAQTPSAAATIPAARAAETTPAAAGPAKTESTSIRVGIDKVDTLINMVGELVITQSMLGQLGNEFEIDDLPKLLEGLSQLEQNTRELQESVMRIRMLPISFTFSRFPRMVRDLSRRLNKKIELKMLGEQTELDKTVMEKIGDPLVHLVRNAIDHGIETPEERLQSGKTESGTITLNAYHQGGNVVIEITDDGKGLNRERILQKAIDNGMLSSKDASQLSNEQVHDLIFQPGFSTAQEVSDVSGRGVGMDVVRRNIQELNGSVEINSTEGTGSRITIRLPLTLAILDGQLVRVGKETYIFPLVSIVESLQSEQKMINQVAGGCDVFQLRDEYVPIIRLFDIFCVEPEFHDLDESLLVVVECDGEKVGIVVDELLAQQQVVIKSLEQNYQRVEGISGATILGDGTVALILDIPGLVKLAGINHQLRSRVSSLASSHQELNQYA